MIPDLTTRDISFADNLYCMHQFNLEPFASLFIGYLVQSWLVMLFSFDSQTITRWPTIWQYVIPCIWIGMIILNLPAILSFTMFV